MADAIHYTCIDGTTISATSFKEFKGRCAVVPYTITPLGKILMFWGIDRPHGDITDWGGSPEQGESIEEAASRELSEESAGMLTISPNLLAKCKIRYSTNAVTFFVECPYDKLMGLITTFPGSHEMISIQSMSLNNTSRGLEDGRFYEVVQEILQPCMPYLYIMESK